MVGRRLATVTLGLLVGADVCHAGIDHRVAVDDSGIWHRNVQYAVEYGTIAAELAGAFWLGGDDPVGKTFWKAMDSSALGAISAEAMKHIFTRARPSQTSDPNQWFQGSGHYSLSKRRSNARDIGRYAVHVRIWPRPSFGMRIELAANLRCRRARQDGKSLADRRDRRRRTRNVDGLSREPASRPLHPRHPAPRDDGRNSQALLTPAGVQFSLHLLI